MPQRKSRSRKAKKKANGNAKGTRSFRLSVAVTDTLAAAAARTGWSANKLLDVAASAAFAALDGKTTAIRKLAALLDAAAANARAERKAKTLTATTRKALRAAVSDLRTSTGEAPTPAEPAPPQRQSA